MIQLIIKDLRHHARLWVWSLAVSLTGGAVVGLIIICWWSAAQWGRSQPDTEPVMASSIIGSNLVAYAGSATAIVLASTLALTVTAQQRSHALWKVLGVPAVRIRRIILGQVAVVGVIGGGLGVVLAPLIAGWYLLTWRDFGLYPVDMPLTTPPFAPGATIAVTAVFSVLGGLGAARRAGATPEMQALREAGAPGARTRWWQWCAAAFLILGAVAVAAISVTDTGAPPPEEAEVDPDVLEAMQQAGTPGDLAGAGGIVGMLLAIAALCVPAWTLRPLLVAWTRLVPSGCPAWFTARANALHRSALSLTTITPFAIAVAMTGTVHSIMGAGRALGAQGGVSGFLAIAVPIFVIAGVGGVANIAMVGASRRRESALLGVLGASRRTVERATVVEGALYAVTGVIFGLMATLVSAICAALLSGGGLAVVAAALPGAELAAVAAACPVLSIAATWVPAVLERRPALDRLRQPA